MTRELNEVEMDLHLADLEDGVSVTAGSLNTDAFFHKVEAQKAEARRDNPLLIVLGRFLNFSRREKKVTPESIAKDIDLDVLTLMQIEEGKVAPEPRIVSRLAKILDLPAGKLMQLAGHTQVLDRDVTTAASAFAMRSKTKPLDEDEREALHEFVKALSQK